MNVLQLVNKTTSLLKREQYETVKDASVMFWTVGTVTAGSMYKSHAQTAFRQSSSYAIKTITVDSRVRYFSLRPDLIKIDVEDAEANVLRGSIYTTGEYKPTYFVEMHSKEELSMIQNASNVLEWCSSQSYIAYYLKEHIVLDDPAIIQRRGGCHLLLLPQGAPYPKGLKPIKQGDLLFSNHP